MLFQTDQKAQEAFLQEISMLKFVSRDRNIVQVRSLRPSKCARTVYTGSTRPTRLLTCSSSTTCWSASTLPTLLPDHVVLQVLIATQTGWTRVFRQLCLSSLSFGTENLFNDVDHHAHARGLMLPLPAVLWRICARGQSLAHHRAHGGEQMPLIC